MAEQVFQIGIKGLIRNDKGEIFMLHVPEYKHNTAHWDLPGGRVEPGETFTETLKRELIEEIGVSYTGEPKQVMGMLTNITIPVRDDLMPLVFIVYEVEIKNIAKIKLSEGSREDKSDWFTPQEASNKMAFKFSTEFCEYISKL